MEIRPVPVAAVIGTDDRGRPYAIANPNADPYARSARERLVISFGVNEEEALVVRSITRTGTTIRAALDAVVMAGVGRDVHDAMAAAATRPDRAEIHGVLFELGGPAEGRVLLPEVHAAAREVFEHAQRGVREQLTPETGLSLTGLTDTVRDPFAAAPGARPAEPT